jgi:hypothetical protein
VSWFALLRPELSITEELAIYPKETKKPMNKTRAAILLSTILLLAVTAFAWQYPGGSQSQQMPQSPQGSVQQDQTSPNSPSQNQGAMQPGQSSQQPGQAGQQAQPGTSQSAPQSSQGSNIDNQVQILAQQLNLNSDQQAKVRTVLEDQHTQAMTIIQDQSLQREDKIQKIHALREGTIAKVRATLTSDDQKQKFDQMVQAQNDRMRDRDQGQQSQPPSQPKQ